MWDFKWNRKGTLNICLILFILILVFALSYRDNWNHSLWFQVHIKQQKSPKIRTYLQHCRTPVSIMPVGSMAPIGWVVPAYSKPGSQPWPHLSPISLLSNYRAQHQTSLSAPLIWDTVLTLKQGPVGDLISYEQQIHFQLLYVCTTSCG